MTKELFKEFITGQIERNNAILTKNSLSDDDKLAVEANIAALQSIVEKIDAMEDSEAVADDLREAVNTINDKINALNEKIEQLQSNETEQTENQMNLNETNYLESKNAMHDFASAIRNSKTTEEFRTNWNEMLSTNGITISEGSEEAYLPTPVRGLIESIWETEADWLRDLTATGAKEFWCRYNTSDQNAENSRAKGWKKGDTKVAQSLNVAAKKLAPGVIYKLQEIDLKTKFDTDEALINFVISELVSQIIAEAKRCILVGDGRADDSDYKISSFEAIAKGTSDAWTTVSTASATFLIDDIVAMVNNIKNPKNKDIYLFVNKLDLTAMRRIQASETSSPVYMDVESLASQCGVSRIITTDFVGGESDFKALAFIPKCYFTVGESITNPKMAEFHDIYKNLDVVRFETIAGGGINDLKSSAVLLKA